MTESALTITLKGAGGFDAPWIVVRADDPAEAVRYLDALGQLGVLATTTNVAQEFAGVYTAASGLGAKVMNVEANSGTAADWGTGSVQYTAPSPAPQFQQFTPAAGGHGPAPLDQYGKPRVYVESKPGAAKAWKAWMGDYPKGDAQGATVSPEWIR